jgi:DNA-binding transcriptional LysR family regulator
MVDAVRDGSLDVALIGAAGTAPDGLRSMIIVREGLSALVPQGHALQHRRTLSLAEVADQPIISMPSGTGIRTTFDRVCVAEGISPTITLEATAAETIAELAARGLGIGIVSTSMADAYRDRVNVVPFTALPVPALLALVWPEVTGPAVRALIPELKEAFAL